MSSNQIEKFKINVKKAFEELEETEFKPTKLQVSGINPKPAYYAEVHKKRYFNKLESFCIDDVILTDDLFKLIGEISCFSESKFCLDSLLILVTILSSSF